MPRYQKTAIPTGVVTRTLQVNPSSTVYGGSSSLEVQVIPHFDGDDVKLVKWQSTNQYLISFFDVRRGSPNEGIFIDLPTVDQAGFILASTDEPINDWFYTVKVRYLLDGRKVGASVTKTLVPRNETPNVVIFDQLPTGNRPNVYQGPRGYSAYQLAVLDGYLGTEDEWLDSLEGKAGAPGSPGRDGAAGAPGTPGKDSTVPGPQGPPGEPGDAASGRQFYTHAQMIAAQTWVINHTLPFIPNIVIVDSTGQTVEGDVRYVGPQRIEVSFSGGFSGTAYLS